MYQLIRSAEAGYHLQDVESQREIGLLLQSFAYPFNQIGKYYKSVFYYRTGQYEKARRLLECVAESAPAQYRSKALLSLSAVEESLGRFEESLRLRLKSLSASDPVILLEAQRGIAVLRSLEGEHGAALRELERLIPLAHSIGRRGGHPTYFSFLNSYALELSEGGKREEAEQVAKLVSASPYVSHRPEWQETISEIEARHKRSSTITVPRGLNLKYRDSRVQRAIDFMNANFHRAIALDNIAEEVNISPAYFTHLFRTETGLTPIDYLIKLRLQKAGKLLATEFLSIKQVMASVGYNSKSHFARHFKRQFGITPSEYRNRLSRWRSS